MSFIFEADLSDTHGDTNTLADLKEVMRRRFSKLRVRVFWESVSETRAHVVVPIVDGKDTQLVKRLISRRGMLEFRMVHEDSDRLIERGEVPPDYQILARRETLHDGSKRIERVIVKKLPEVGLTSGIVARAIVVQNNLSKPRIDVALTRDSKAAFARVTREHVGQRLAIVLDGELYSAPVIRSPIETGRAQITGHFDLQEALELASVLECPLPVPVTLLEEKSF